MLCSEISKLSPHTLITGMIWAMAVFVFLPGIVFYGSGCTAPGTTPTDGRGSGEVGDSGDGEADVSDDVVRDGGADGVGDNGAGDVTTKDGQETEVWKVCDPEFTCGAVFHSDSPCPDTYPTGVEDYDSDEFETLCNGWKNERSCYYCKGGGEGKVYSGWYPEGLRAVMVCEENGRKMKDNNIKNCGE